MKTMRTVQDLIEEAKVRTVWWFLCIFAITYFLSHTSKSMLMNIPIAVLLVAALHLVLNEVEIRRKVQPHRPQTYLTLLERKQLSLNDSRLSTPPPPPKWRRKIDFPVVEAAVDEIIDKILKDFVTDLWYSHITPDKDFQEQIRGIIFDAIGEISGRVKAINLVDLLTRDIIDLVGDHLDVFRRIQTAIGADVMRTLSSEERDERLKYHLMASKELHPALISPESEYKVLQQLVSGVLASVLRPREAQCPVVRSIAREFVTCLVVQPLMSFASPVYLNEILELIFIAMKEDGNNLFSFGADKSTPCMPSQQDVSIHCNQVVDASSHKADDSSPNVNQDDQKQLKAGDWAMGLEAATQRRTEVLMPENLENLWSRGRNYRKKEACKVRGECEEPLLSKSTGSISNSNLLEFHTSLSRDTIEPEEKMAVRFNTNSVEEASSPVGGNFNVDDSSVNDKNLFAEDNSEHELNDTVNHDTNGEGTLLKTSSSTSTLKAQTDSEKAFTGEAGGRIMPTLHSPRLGNCNGEDKVKNEFEFNHGSQGSHTLKLSCRVMGASFEKLGSKSFAVYSIAVRDTESKTWLVKRRYSNFEQLHRYLKEIPNYTLHLPPKRIFSSSTEDAFVHQRCIQLHKYLQDVLSIANVAEQHEVWDFLSASSKNYSCGKSSSVIETLAVNVDDAVDDIFRQFKGVSNGLMRVVVGPTPSGSEYTSLITEMNLPLRANESDTNISGQNTEETSTSISDDEGGKDQNHCPKVDQMIENAPVVVNSLAGPHQWGDPNGMPPEWTPPNVLVPMLNLVDKVFQLNRRGWLRRQVFWMSKQIAQMVMEDAIDDFLLTQIHWLRREETIAQGIRWVQDILWPNGKFFISLRSIPTNLGDDAQQDGRLLNTVDSHVGSKLSSFEMHLEATRRANELKKLLFDGAPAALVSLVGHKQYRRCARDIYYFSQSTICVKQLVYCVLELLLISVFPELRDLVLDIHQKMAPEAPGKNSHAA